MSTSPVIAGGEGVDVAAEDGAGRAGRLRRCRRAADRATPTTGAVEPVGQDDLAGHLGRVRGREGRAAVGVVRGRSRLAPVADGDDGGVGQAGLGGPVVGHGLQRGEDVVLGAVDRVGRLDARGAVDLEAVDHVALSSRPRPRARGSRCRGRHRPRRRHRCCRWRPPRRCRGGEVVGRHRVGVVGRAVARSPATC